jgi:lipid-binding SYLF domain-containing protein
MRTISFTLTMFLAASYLMAGENETKRLQAATDTLNELAGAGDKGIPLSLLSKAHCVAVIPGMKKGGFIVGGKYGRGFSSCRTTSNKLGWSAPLAMRVEGGSFGLQAGGASSDIVMLFMNDSGMKHLLADKFTLGGEASAAAGPVGRDAEAMTDATMHAEILTYSRSQGVFGGLALNGATLRPDTEANQGMYGKDVDGAKVLGGQTPAPPAVQSFLDTLRKYSPNLVK